MRVIFAMVIAFIAALSFVACQRDGDFDPNNPARPVDSTNATMKAQVNGALWLADEDADAARIQGLINITGISKDKKYISITLSDSGVHHYVLSGIGPNAAALVDSSETTPLAYTTNQGTYPAQAGGEVTITAIDTSKKTISGNFSFTLFRKADGAQKMVAEGRFINVEYIAALPSSLPTDTLRMKVNGVLWAPESIVGKEEVSLDQIAIHAADANAEKTMSLNVPSDIAPGSYALDFWGGIYVAAYNPDTNPTHSKAAVSGTLIIIEHDAGTKRLRGTFAFRGEEASNSQNVAEISEGYFSVGY